MIRHFINLSGGIEAIGDFDFEFVRIQSTDCEHKMGPPQWEAILTELDANFLMALARGDECRVYDSSAEGESHAQTWGLAWIRFALNVAWFGRITQPVVDGEDASKLFTRLWWKHMGKRTKRKILYFGNFVETKDIKLEAVSVKAKHDGDWPYYRKALKNAGR